MGAARGGWIRIKFMDLWFSHVLTPSSEGPVGGGQGAVEMER